jgi:rhodanese-related sulfurtransferase
MRTVSRDELRVLWEADSAVVVEALSAEAYEAEHIPGAVNVPSALTAELAAAVATNPAATVVVYCSGRSCTRSKVTAAEFERLGYDDVRVYPGGKADSWEGGLPLAGHRAEVREVR